MSNVIGNIEQKDHYQTYSPTCHLCNGGGCNCFSCSSFTTWDSCNNGDWHYDYENCCVSCPSKPLCSKLNSSNCDIGLNSNKKTPFLSANWNSAPNVSCVFDKTKIDTVPQVNSWISKFGKSGDYNKIISDISQRIHTDDCMPNPLTKETPKQCSSLFQNSDMGKLSRDWFNSMSQASKDGIIKSICDKSPSLVECQCYSRAKDQIYKKLKPPIMDDDTTPSTPINDACWWETCKGDSDRFLLSSDVVNRNCKINNCQKLANQMIANNVSKSDIENKTSCSFNYSCTKDNSCLLSTCTDTAKPNCYDKSNCNNICSPPSPRSGGSSFPVIPVVLGGVGIVIVVAAVLFFIRIKSKHSI